MATETREIKDIEKVVLRGYGELFIKQGEVESLVIETDEEFLDRVKTRVEDGVLKIDVVGEWLDRISTFFSRGYESQRIKYYLTVIDMDILNISGAARVRMDELVTDEFAMKLGGAGDIDIALLDVDKLIVNLPGAGNIKVAGTADVQQVQVGGAGAYSARKLKSQTAEVKITGVGKAIVSVVEDLVISISGLGSVEYYGNPRVKQSLSGLGHVVSKE